MNVAIIGAGAVGLALGSCLHVAGHGIHYIVRPRESPHPLQRAGLRRTGIFGEVRVPPEALRISTSVAALRDWLPDHILVCTKTTASGEVAAALGGVFDRLARTPNLIVCQNGWGNAETFAQHIPGARVYSARIITGFRAWREHEVDVTVHADAIHMGSLFGDDPAELSELCEAIAAGGIPCEPSADIERDLIAKLLYNCLLNPMGALVREPYGGLGKRPVIRAIMAAVASEIFAVLQASGHQTHWSCADEYLEVFYRDLLPPTAEHEPSMLQDLRAGRATEIDALCGAVVTLGAEHEVQTPINLALTTLLHAAERSGPSYDRPAERAVTR